MGPASWLSTANTFQLEPSGFLAAASPASSWWTCDDSDSIKTIAERTWKVMSVTPLAAK